MPGWSLPMPIMSASIVMLPIKYELSTFSNLPGPAVVNCAFSDWIEPVINPWSMFTVKPSDLPRRCDDEALMFTVSRPDTLIVGKSFTYTALAPTLTLAPPDTLRTGETEVGMPGDSAPE